MSDNLLSDLYNKLVQWINGVRGVQSTSIRQTELQASTPEPSKVQPSPAEQTMPATQPVKSAIIPQNSATQQAQMPTGSPKQVRQGTEPPTPAPAPAPTPSYSQPAPYIPPCSNPTAQHNIYLSNGMSASSSNHADAWSYKASADRDPSSPQVTRITRLDVSSDPSSPSGYKAVEVQEYP